MTRFASVSHLMPSPIVHIGFHKTATSWFQTAIFPQLTSHRYINRDLVKQLFMGGDAFGFDAADTRVALGLDGKGPPPLISEEDFSGILHIGLSSSYIAKEIARRVHATMPESKILILIRSQTSAAYSWYSQYLREGGTASLQRYLFPDSYLYTGKSSSFKTARFDFSQLEYKGLIEEYDRLFGPDNVYVFAYEDFVRDQQDTLDAIKRQLDMELSGCGSSPGGVNASYRRGLLRVARILNLFTGRAVPNKKTIVHVPHWYVARRMILDTLNRLPLFGARATSESSIDRYTRERIAERFWRSNCWLAGRLNRDLGALGYPVAPPANDSLPPVRNSLLRWTRR
jgi:hypothetical protein